MKKILLFLVTIFTIGIFGQIAPPTAIKQPTIRADFRSFSYTGTTLWAVAYEFGFRSLVLKSTNSGDTWQIFAPAIFRAQDNLTAIHFPDNNTGYVGGTGGKIYKTTNAGLIWTDVSDTVLYSGGINGMYFSDVNNGFAVGSSAAGSNILRTTNGGTNWSAVPTPVSSTAYDIYFDTPQNGWVTCGSGVFLRTTDGGATWFNTTVTGTTSTIYSIRKADATTYYMTGTSGQVYRSTNSGVNFASVTSPQNLPFYSSEFSDANNGIVFGSNGVTYKTTNGGTSWTLIPALAGEVIRGSIKIGNTIIAGAYKSTIHKSTDMGVTWSYPLSPYRDFWGVYRKSANEYIVCGDRGEIHYTTNAGANWTRVPVRPTTQILYDVIWTGNYIYTCGRNGEYFISSDMGSSWTLRSVGSNQTRHYKLYFLNETTGYMVNNDGNVYYTTDRGMTWNSRAIIPSTILYDIKMINTSTGYTVGSGERIFKTTDGGTTWSHGTMATPAGQVLGLYMLNETTGYISGENGSVYRTTDGFQNITLLTDTVALQGKLIHDVYAYDMNNITAVGQGGTILNSFGTNLIQAFQTVFGEDIIAVDGRGAQSMVMSGASGTVYYFDGFLPVELTSFRAESKNGAVLLQWITATETNNRGFAVEKRSGELWSEIGFVPGAGNSASRRSYTFTDLEAGLGKTAYRLKQIDYDGAFIYSPEIEVDNNAPSVFLLEQNYPNPFNPSTTFGFQLMSESFVKLSIFNIQGEEITTLFNDKLPAGRHAVDFDASELSSGVYIYRITAGSFTASGKMTLMK